MGIDFEAEGLLDGVDGDERAARLALLESLDADGCEVDELRQAIDEGRLALLPVERALLPPGPKHTLAEVAEQSGLDEAFVAQLIRALGLPLPIDGEANQTELDLEAARAVAKFRDAGIPDEGILEISRVMGNALGHVVAATRGVVGPALVRPGDTEHDLSMRLADAARTLNPELEAVLSRMMRAHQIAQVRQDAVDLAGIVAGRTPGATQVSVAFADMSGFTRLGERVPADELGGVAGRLTALASQVSSPPVRLVKMIGDAAMLVSPEPEPLLRAVLDLVDLADQEGEDFPQLRGGVAIGEGITRGGDWYGRPVNLASRITDKARPGSVVTTGEFRESVPDGPYEWSKLPRKRLKGVSDEVTLYRARYAEDTEANAPNSST